MNDNLSEFLTFRRKSGSEPAIMNDEWSFDEMDLSFYDSTFSEALGHSISEEVSDLQNRFGQVRAANIMGGLTVLRELPITEGWAIRLKDTRAPAIVQKDTMRNLHVITGNILHKQTIANIPKDLHLVLVLPQGGWLSIPPNPDLYYHLGSTILNKLTVGGMALIQLPSSHNNWLREYLTLHKTIPGLQLTYYAPDPDQAYSVLAMRKLSADAHLPKMTS